jgi:hypothetical protein
MGSNWGMVNRSFAGDADAPFKLSTAECSLVPPLLNELAESIATSQ